MSAKDNFVEKKERKKDLGNRNWVSGERKKKSCRRKCVSALIGLGEGVFPSDFFFSFL